MDFVSKEKDAELLRLFSRGWGESTWGETEGAVVPPSRLLTARRGKPNTKGRSGSPDPGGRSMAEEKCMEVYNNPKADRAPPAGASGYP